MTTSPRCGNLSNLQRSVDLVVVSFLAAMTRSHVMFSAHHLTYLTVIYNGGVVKGKSCLGKM